jgi:hypothetical protein
MPAIISPVEVRLTLLSSDNLKPKQGCNVNGIDSEIVSTGNRKVLRYDTTKRILPPPPTTI